MTNYLESHRSESSKQTSLYYKIVLFRWVTTAILIFGITNFTDTLQVGKTGILTQVLALFVSDMTLTNVLQLADPVSFETSRYLSVSEAWVTFLTNSYNLNSVNRFIFLMF